MFKQQDLQMFGLKLSKLSNFHPLEVVGHGSETQIQVSENLKYTKFSAVRVDTRFKLNKLFYSAKCKVHVGL